MSLEKKGIASYKEFTDEILDRVYNNGYNCL